MSRRGSAAVTNTLSPSPPAALDKAASTPSHPSKSVLPFLPLPSSLTIHPSLHAKTLSLRSQVLLALVVQNASIPLLTRLSRSPSSSSVGIYNPAIAILMTEIVKAAVSLACHGVERRQRKRVREKVDRGWQAWVRESGKMVVPAGLYSVQNRLLVSPSSTPLNQEQIADLSPPIEFTVYSFNAPRRPHLPSDVPIKTPHFSPLLHPLLQTFTLPPPNHLSPPPHFRRRPRSTRPTLPLPLSPKYPRRSHDRSRSHTRRLRK